MANDTIVIMHEVEPQEISVRVFSVDCDCGASLSYSVKADSDNDLIVRVNAHICEQEEE